MTEGSFMSVMWYDSDELRTIGGRKEVAIYSANWRGALLRLMISRGGKSSARRTPSVTVTLPDRSGNDLSISKHHMVPFRVVCLCSKPRFRRMMAIGARPRQTWNSGFSRAWSRQVAWRRGGSGGGGVGVRKHGCDAELAGVPGSGGSHHGRGSEEQRGQ
eukprot:1629439-Pleurochrysis_carterae.AAC.2